MGYLSMFIHQNRKSFQGQSPSGETYSTSLDPHLQFTCANTSCSMFLEHRNSIMNAVRDFK